MWYFADFNILIRKIILNKFQFQPQSVLNLFLFLGDFSLGVLIKFVLIKKKSVIVHPWLAVMNLMYESIPRVPMSPPGWPPGIWHFKFFFGQIPHHAGPFFGQMPPSLGIF